MSENEDGNRERQSSSPARHNSTSMPSIFADGGWDKLNNTIISTSNCGNPSLRQFGFGPTSADGFGIGYIIKDDGISICASSKHRQTKRFVDALESYLLEMRRILKSTQRHTSQKSSRAREASSTRPRMAGSRLKSHGRVIKGEKEKPKSPSTITPASDEGVLSDDDGLGGCKYWSWFYNTSTLIMKQMAFSMQVCFCRHLKPATRV
jgi:carnitine O-acetyltransferase